MAAVTPTTSNKCVGTFTDGTPNINLYCEKTDASHVCATWRNFVAACPKLNQLCGGKSSAWVAAITVCNQRLF